MNKLYNEIMKSARYIVAGIIILVIISATILIGGFKIMSSEKNEEMIYATTVTEMQKLLAEKSYKMPG